MPYWQLFYHIIWSTKKRLPLITSDVELVIHNFVRDKAIGLGATVFALNGTEDHIHLVAAIPPKIAVSKFIGQVKAVASTKFNKSNFSKTTLLFWQEEYGVFSFDKKRLPNFIAYVERQKEHHMQATIIPALERSDDTSVKFVSESFSPYSVEEAGWRAEIESLG